MTLTLKLARVAVCGYALACLLGVGASGGLPPRRHPASRLGHQLLWHHGLALAQAVDIEAAAVFGLPPVGMFVTAKTRLYSQAIA